MKIKTIIISIFFLVTLAPLSVSAQLLNETTRSNIRASTELAGTESGFKEDATVGSVMTIVIAAFLSMLGIVFLILMLVGGYKWMNAQGNEESVNEAKSSIQRAIIGLIITVAAYAITYFVFNAIDWVN